MLDRVTIERMRALAGEGPILIALSGGGDSVALLHLLVAEFGAPRLRAAIVDHALREGSAPDAARALGFAQALGVVGEVHTLSWAPGENHAQQAAREARYAALCAQARKLGARIIAVAHNADDQAETVFMRARAGSSWRGLAGMTAIAPAPLWPEGRGVLLARPLLGVRRTALRDYLRARAAAWIEDPANSNPAFERVRARQLIAALEAAGFDPMRLARLAARLREKADAVDRLAADLIARAVRVERDVRIERAVWLGPAQVRQRALGVLMAAASGATRAPAFAILEQLELTVMRAGYSGGTHSGVRFVATDTHVRLTRDPGAVRGRADGAAKLPDLRLAKDAPLVWDGRLLLTAREHGWSAVAAENRDLLALKRAGLGKRLEEVAGAVECRAMLAEHVTHLLWRVNDAQV